MPRIPYQEEFGGGGGAKFPTVKLVANQRIRLVCPENPFSELVHRIEAPQFQNGEPLMKRRDAKDPTSPLVYDAQWLGNPICLGDPDVVKAEGGLDVQGCITCAVSKEMNGEGVLPPLRRYSMNVVEYMTNTDGSLVQPFGVRILIWAFTAKIFDKIIAIKNEFGDLSGVDLILGPVEGPLVFQRYPITTGNGCVARSSADTFRVVQTAWTSPGNRATDEQLKAACGKPVQLQYLTRDLDTAKQRWAMAKAAGGPLQPGMTVGGNGQLPQQSLQGGFDSILGGGQPQPGGAFAAAAAPDMAQLHQQQMGQLAAAGVPQTLLPQQPHPLEQQAAAASADPFGGSQPQASPVQPQAVSQQDFSSPFGAQPPAPQQPAPAPQVQQQGFASPFGAQGPAQPPQAAPAPQQPFGSVQPAQPQPGGLGEFSTMTTSNPQQAPQPAPAFAGQGFGEGFGQPQQPAPAPQQPAQPSFTPPPAAPAPQQGGAPSFDALLEMGGQQGQPGQ